MLFNSYPFLLLVIITFFIYYSRPFERHQVLVLIISSLIFYGYTQPYLLILLCLSASINAVTSYAVCFEKTEKRRKLLAISGVTFNLLILAFFKYNRLLDGMAVKTISETDNLLHLIINIPLPVGISFYTFQGISLVMDLYKPAKTYNIDIDRDFLRHYKKTFFFITFFPQLVAGPILKAHAFFPQISRKYLKNIDTGLVFKALVMGYFLKSVIADNLKDQTFWITHPYFETQSSLTLVTMLFGYSVQIFADFAGYSLIAIGVAAIFGYNLPQNFNYPYISGTIAEFWSRWHISLSSWLKEYLYIRLGGNRKGNIRTYANLITVMFLGGLWHGAAMSYGVWGLWHGIGLAIERFLLKHKRHNLHPGTSLRFLRITFVFTFVTFGWLLFKLTNINEAVNYIIAIKKNTGLTNNFSVILNVIFYSLPVFLYHVIYLIKKNDFKIAEVIFRHDYAVYSVMFVMILINGGIPGEFVYFQF